MGEPGPGAAAAENAHPRPALVDERLHAGDQVVLGRGAGRVRRQEVAEAPLERLERAGCEAPEVQRDRRVVREGLPGSRLVQEAGLGALALDLDELADRVR